MFGARNGFQYSRLNNEPSNDFISNGRSSTTLNELFIPSNSSSIPYSRLSSDGSRNSNLQADTSFGRASTTNLLPSKSTTTISFKQGNDFLSRSSNITGGANDRIPGIGASGRYTPQINEAISNASPISSGKFNSIGITNSSTPMQSGIRNLWSQQEAQIAKNAVSMTAGSTAKAASAGLGTMGLSAFVAQQAGQGINDLMTNSETAQQRADYATNMQNLHLGGEQSANIVKDQQQGSIDSKNTAGMIGSLFGPVGTLVGHALGGKSFDSESMKTFNSITGGKVDPTDSGISGSLNASAASGTSTIQQNVN